MRSALPTHVERFSSHERAMSTEGRAVMWSVKYDRGGGMGGGIYGIGEPWARELFWRYVETYKDLPGAVVTLKRGDEVVLECYGYLPPASLTHERSAEQRTEREQPAAAEERAE